MAFLGGTLLARNAYNRRQHEAAERAEKEKQAQDNMARAMKTVSRRPCRCCRSRHMKSTSRSQRQPPLPGQVCEATQEDLRPNDDHLAYWKIIHRRLHESVAPDDAASMAKQIEGLLEGNDDLAAIPLKNQQEGAIQALKAMSVNNGVYYPLKAKVTHVMPHSSIEGEV